MGRELTLSGGVPDLELDSGVVQTHRLSQEGSYNTIYTAIKHRILWLQLIVILENTQLCVRNGWITDLR